MGWMHDALLHVAINDVLDIVSIPQRRVYALLCVHLRLTAIHSLVISSHSTPDDTLLGVLGLVAT